MEAKPPVAVRASMTLYDVLVVDNTESSIAKLKMRKVGLDPL